ncbi:hypothetical protein EIP91_012128 [Steccherinum ochraceum]|uniref:Nudix hydrolase domain-containing protein n=1 Tax=Steccherinum ochraceum TaxID=92696 RepID=A0A4R0RY77_9APHY|nr:hypothetical protein EIP91_012128 [Steccherinum ochraceum]
MQSTNVDEHTTAEIQSPHLRPTLGHPQFILSPESSPAIPDSGYFASNFMLGVGVLIIQPATGKVVVVRDVREDGSVYWFFPKGRKDVGEDFREAALREAYEESGYRVSLMPLFTPSKAPNPAKPVEDIWKQGLNTEPIYMSNYYWAPDAYNKQIPHIYLTLWYVAELAQDAVYHEGTGVETEENFETHLMEYEEAILKVEAPFKEVLRLGYKLWKEKVQRLAVEAEQSQ